MLMTLDMSGFSKEYLMKVIYPQIAYNGRSIQHFLYCLKLETTTSTIDSLNETWLQERVDQAFKRWASPIQNTIQTLAIPVCIHKVRQLIYIEPDIIISNLGTVCISKCI